MNLEQNQLPPRRSRHSRPKASFSLKKWVQSGLLLFGLLFFGLIGFELYKANAPHETAGSVDFSVANETTVASQTGEAEPESVVLPSTPDPNAAVENTSDKTKETQAKPVEPVTTVVQTNQKPAVKSTASTTTAGTSDAMKDNQATGKTIQNETTAVKKPPTPAPKAKVVKHVVKKGETLFMLSRKYYGNNSNVSRIANYNGFSADAGLTEGRVVLVPLAH